MIYDYLMSKWADFLISAAVYDGKHKILKVRQHKDNGSIIDDGQIIDRDAIIENLKNGSKMVTIFSSNSTWKLGDKINLIKFDGSYFIRTDNNKVGTDNLRLLPELN